MGDTLLHVLQLEGPPCNGLNVGTAFDRLGCTYRWEGEVEDGKATGCGKKTCTAGAWSGTMSWGIYKDGNPCGKIVRKTGGPKYKYMNYESGRVTYDRNNAHYELVLEEAKEKSAAARTFICQPWSPTTNHWGKWKHMQDIVLTVALVGERLHRIELTDQHLLMSLPSEIWEMILKFVLTT
eukprot:m.94276 g.94276  ORF g.94276 m.94276 type:complete len:181 (-) comp13436_c0_seq2:44-586(-)